MGMMKAAASLLLLPSAHAYVCQVLTQENESLQASLGLECTVDGQYCNCSSSFVNGVVWLLASEPMNYTMNSTAKPGEWYIMDATGQCVAAFGTSSTEPTVQKCPPGFYCAGGLEPPRSCSSGDHCPVGTGLEDRSCPLGFYCPIPAADVRPCPAGGHCPRGAQSPQACQAGRFCPPGEDAICPQGHYCPYGTEAPKRCKPLFRCPPGSKAEDPWFFSLAILGAVVGVGFLGSMLYMEMVQNDLWACAVCAACAGLMWLVDEAIALFLSLTFVSVAANWALLRIGGVDPAVAQSLLLCTAGVAVALLWLVHPPWAVFFGGLLMCCAIAYLMSRQNRTAVLVGRLLLLVAFAALIFSYSQVDPGFTVALGIVLLIQVLGIILSWVLEQRRQQRRVALPFLTRWRWQRGEVGLFQSELPEVEAGQMPAPRDRERPAAAEVRESASAASLASGGTSPTNPGQRSSSSSPISTLPGVSFRLEDVGFELPDGKKLLKEIDFTIDAGRRVAVMGPSGSGKTTLLGVLSGRASYGRVSGKLTVGGRPADDLRFLQNVTGFVPQDDVLHGELTVAENLRFQASLRLPAGRSREEVDACVTAVAKDLNLSSLLNARVGTPERRGVSGGQRKRVSIGMELVAQPLLLFADEPTSGLDSTTSHEVVRCLNGAAARLNSTVVAVIHQPRYETLRLFDDLVLLAYGGCLVYAGPTEDAVEHFKTRLHVTFSNNTNPADILLDAIQPPINEPEVCASAWKSCAALQDKVEQMVLPASIFRRTRQPFFRAVLIYMDRSMLQTIRAYVSLAINYSLCCVAVLLLCMILTYNRLDQFLMQSALAALFLMLLQGVAAQQVFGADLLTTWREARVGMPMVAYFVAKDLTACIEVTLSSAVFAAAYGYASGSQVSLRQLFAGSWAFVFAIFGLNYIFSIILSPGAAQMSAVVTSFLSFCTAGVYQPQLNEMASMFEGRGWMVPALSPVRWLWGYLLTAEVPNLTPLTLQGSAGTLRGKGYDVEYLHDCKNSMVGIQDQAVRTLQEAWLDNRGWVCSTAPLLLLGILFRFLAGCCLLLYVSAQTSGWARFFGQSELGAWKLAGHFFKLLVGSFLIIFLFAEVWIFGSLHLDFKGGHFGRQAVQGGGDGVISLW